MVQYQQESFSGKTFASGYVSEAAQNLQKAGLAYTCDNKGQPTFLFYPRGFGFDQAVDVDFKGKDGVKTFHFAIGKLNTLGQSRVLPQKDVPALRALFENAKDSELPFKQDDSSGAFTAIGADSVFKIIEAGCSQ
jgi:hypothetical protein